MFRRLCLLVLVTVGCGGVQHVPKPGEEYLAGIRIEGNAAIETDELVEGLSLHRAEEAGRALDPYQLTVDTDRIRAAYQQLGYFEVDVRARVDHAGLAQKAVFKVIEGRRAKTQVVIDGLPADVSMVAARALVELTDGGGFDYEKFDDAKQPLITLVENAGYAHVQLDAEVLADRTHAQATVRYVFDPGPSCTFGAVTLTGVDGPLADAVRARVAIRPGERFSAAALTETQRAIYELGRFSSARVEPDRGGTDVIAVKLSLALANRFESKLGGGFGYEPATVEVRGRASITAAGLPGPLWNAGIDLRPAYTINHKLDLDTAEPKIRLLGTLQRLDLFKPFIKGEIEVGFDFLTFEAYTSAGAHGRLGLSAPLGFRWLQFRIGWLIEELAFSGLNEAVLPSAMRLGLDRRERLGEYQQAIAADLRDDPIEPRRGAYLEVRVAEGTKFAGGAFEFIQLTPEARGYIPLGRSVLALRTRLGMILGDVPVTERYFSGGASSQRGFSERRLSPLAFSTNMNGAPISVQVGGAASIEAGIELRGPQKKLWGLQLGGVIFLDGGDVTDAAADLDPWKLHWATGLGARLEVIKSIVVRVDVGYRLNRTTGDLPASGIYDRLALHLGVGQAY